MTVRQLKKMLRKYDKDTQVYMVDGHQLVNIKCEPVINKGTNEVYCVMWKEKKEG